MQSGSAAGRLLRLVSAALILAGLLAAQGRMDGAPAELLPRLPYGQENLYVLQQ